MAVSVMVSFVIVCAKNGLTKNMSSRHARPPLLVTDKRQFNQAIKNVETPLLVIPEACGL